VSHIESCDRRQRETESKTTITTTVGPGVVVIVIVAFVIVTVGARTRSVAQSRLFQFVFAGLFFTLTNLPRNNRKSLSLLNASQSKLTKKTKITAKATTGREKR